MYVTVNGARLFFDTVGASLRATDEGPKAAPVLIVLHGGPGFEHWGLRWYFDRFADQAQVVYLDHRGNGRSRGLAGSDTSTWTLDQWGDDIRAFSDALGIEKPIVFGQSFGGMVAQAYAARHPGHAGGLVFSSTAALMKMDEVLDAFGAYGGPEARTAADHFWNRGTEADIEAYLLACMHIYNTTPRDPTAGAGAIYSWDVYRHFSLPGGEIRRMDLRSGLAAVTSPTLVLTGVRDPVTPPSRAKEIFAALPPRVARYEEIAGTGHGTFRDAPEQTEILLRDFIGEVF